MATPETDRFIADKMSPDPFVALLEICAVARRLETERDALASALRDLVEVSEMTVGMGFTEYREDMDGPLPRARAALAALDKS